MFKRKGGGFLNNVRKNCRIRKLGQNAAGTTVHPLNRHFLGHFLLRLLRKASKKEYFTVRLSALTVSKCENYDLFPLNFDSLIPKTHFMSL